MAEHYFRRSIAARLDPGRDMCAGLPALDAEEQAFVEELLAGRAGPGALVEIITARYGPYEPWHPIDDEGLRVVE